MHSLTLAGTLGAPSTLLLLLVLCQGLEPLPKQPNETQVHVAMAKWHEIQKKIEVKHSQRKKI